VRSAYFEEKGLVRQQLDSFDEFIQNTMQELVDDSGDIRVSPEIQHMVGYDDEAYDEDQSKGTKLVFEVHFGQVYLSKPTTVEKDGTVTNMFPHEARLRNLTYSAPLYVDVDLSQYEVPREVNVNDPSEDLGEPVATEHAKKEFLGYVPIMLRSLFCVLSDKDDADLSDLGECIYDQGRSLAYDYWFGLRWPHDPHDCFMK
jgi:DNA-directed RNA polymerase II subunit RPB2